MPRKNSKRLKMVPENSFLCEKNPRSPENDREKIIVHGKNSDRPKNGRKKFRMTKNLPEKFNVLKKKILRAQKIP